MKLFGNKEREERPVNPGNMLMIRMLAVGYLLYCLWDIIRMYMEGGEDAPSIPLLIGAIVVLGGGAVWIAITSFKQWKRMQAEASAALDAEDAAAEEEASEDPQEEPQEEETEEKE